MFATADTHFLTSENTENVLRSRLRPVLTGPGAAPRF